MKDDNLPYRRWESPHGDTAALQLVLPLAIRREVLLSLHNDPSDGHFGQRQTLEKVRNRFYWPGMSRDVEEWCRCCNACATRKTTGRTPRAPLCSSRSGYPMERVALDIMGPLPTTERNNRYILVIGDYLSKWVAAFPMPNQEPTTAARTFFDGFICRFGTPAYLHSDQGRNFESALFKELCVLLGIKKTHTTAYHPQSDGFF